MHFKNQRNTRKQKRKQKRKLQLNEITRCNPNTKRSSKRCLPPNIYSEIATKLRKSSDDVFQAVGCKPDEEHCLLDKAPLDENVKKTLRKQYLRPRRPKEWANDPDKWLDNYNIIHVMKQYEEAYAWFSFMGVFPIDFSAPDPYRTDGKKQCLYSELCSLNLVNEYNKGKRGLGFVFNLDPHFKGGSHWVGLYIDLKDIEHPFAGYFDSYGYKTPDLIARLMKSLTLQVNTCKLGFNARRFQYSHTECGMFSLYFIICMIHSIPFDQFCKDTMSDKHMLELRKILFAL
jgi:hypothetical protein